MKKRNIINETKVIFLSKYSLIIFNILLNIILSRILLPKDFGIAAIISVFINFFSVISDIGIGSAIIQNKELTTKDEEEIFSFTVYLGIFLSLCFIILLYFLSIIYKEKTYSYMGFILMPIIFFNTINTVPNAVLMKKKFIKELGIRNFISGLAGCMSAVLFAVVFKHYFAILIQSAISTIILVLWNYLSIRLKFRFKINLNVLNKVKDFSTYWFMFNIVNYFTRNLDNILIGKFMGNKSLGFYDKAYKLMLYPTQNLTYIINPILHTVLSDYQLNIEDLYNKYIKVLKFLSLLGIYISIISWFCSNEIIIILFGNNWIDSVSCFKVLSLSLWFQIIAGSAGAIYASIGKTKLLFKGGIVYITIQLILLFCSLTTGNIYYVAMVTSFGFIIKFFIEFYNLVVNGLKKNLYNFYKIFFKHIFIALLLVITMNFFQSIIASSNIYFSFGCKLAVCSLVYIILLYVTKEYKYLEYIKFNR